MLRSLRRLLLLLASLQGLLRGVPRVHSTEISPRGSMETDSIALIPLSRFFLDNQHRMEKHVVTPRDEPASPENSITLVNPLSWQLSSTFNPTSADHPVPNIYSQPKAVISSAFPFLDGSNYSPGLRIPPGWSFSVGFHPIFSPRSEDSSQSRDGEVFISYSLRLQDGSDLPSWMIYDAGYMTLSGVTPWIDGTGQQASQEVYTIRMIASVLEYNSDRSSSTNTIAQSFSLVVASHSFECLQKSQEPGILALNITKGGERLEQPLFFGGSGGIDGVYLDAQPVGERDIESVRVDAEWASLQPEKGSSPRMLTLSRWDSDKTVLPITLVNTYGEELDVLLSLNFQDSVFLYSATAGWFEKTDLTIGQEFSISLERNMTRKIEQQGLQQKVLVVESVPPWMRLRLDPLGVSGSVPEDVANDTLVGLIFRYTDPHTFAVSKVKWNITLLSANQTDGGVDPFTGDRLDGGAGLSRQAVVVIAVFTSLLGVASLAFTGFFIRKRRRARKEESRKWAEVLLRDRGSGSRSGSVSSTPFTSNLKSKIPGRMANSFHLQRPEPAYHQELASSRPASPSKLKTLLESAITPTKKARKIALDLKNRSKRYTRSFMSYPMEYLEATPNRTHATDQSTPPSSSMPIQPPPPPPSPRPWRPASVAASVAPFAFADPPMSGLPSTNFTSDTFLHGRHAGCESPASWEDSPLDMGEVGVFRAPSHGYAESDNWLRNKMVVMNPEEGDRVDQSSTGRPPNFFYAELCHRNSSILRTRDAAPFPSSINSFADSVKTDERLADAPSVEGR